MRPVQRCDTDRAIFDRTQLDIRSPKSGLWLGRVPEAQFWREDPILTTRPGNAVFVSTNSFAVDAVGQITNPGFLIPHVDERGTIPVLKYRLESRCEVLMPIKSTRVRVSHIPIDPRHYLYLEVIS